MLVNNLSVALPSMRNIGLWTLVLPTMRNIGIRTWVLPPNSIGLWRHRCDPQTRIRFVLASEREGVLRDKRERDFRRELRPHSSSKCCGEVRAFTAFRSTVMGICWKCERKCASRAYGVQKWLYSDKYARLDWRNASGSFVRLPYDQEIRWFLVSMLLLTFNKLLP